MFAQQQQQQQQQQQPAVNAYGQNAQQAAAMQTAMDPAAGCTYCPHIMIGIGVLLLIPGIILSIMMASDPFGFRAGPAGPFCLLLGIFLTLTGSMCMCHRRRVLAAQAAGLPLGYYGYWGGRRNQFNPGMPPPGPYGPGYVGPQAGYPSGVVAPPGPYGPPAGYPPAGYPPANPYAMEQPGGFHQPPPSYDSMANKY